MQNKEIEKEISSRKNRFVLTQKRSCWSGFEKSLEDNKYFDIIECKVKHATIFVTKILFNLFC
jgi:hypothetical protein